MRAAQGLPIVVVALLSAWPGCERARHYGERPAAPVTSAPPGPAPAPSSAPAALDPTLLWQDPGPTPPPDVPLEFVHADTNPEVWHKLPQFWNAPLVSRPAGAAAVLGLSPLAAGALAGENAASVVRIKVPLGLDDPRPFFPAINPPTLHKWELGRTLFFDDTWLHTAPGVACASCHLPQAGFANHKNAEHESVNVPTLLNCVYNSRQFWDGRVRYLEEVVQRSLQDEREPAGREPFRHVWGGVVERLRKSSRYNNEFDKVFGTPPTADALAKALATYLRTLLCGNSIHDRALQAHAPKGGKELTAADYEKVLDDAAPAELERPGEKKADVARELHRGYRLFYSLDESHRVNCMACHSGRNFTDEGFHNLGLDGEPVPGQETGRFATAPLGEKDRYLIGAYKTPTLRSLLRTGPYYHNGSAAELDEVVFPHAHRTRYLDPELRLKDHIRGEDLQSEETKALVLFLRSLNGEVAQFLQTPPGR